MDRLKVLGIRHHGPGSAASVVRALNAIDPAEVLVEGAPEANELVPFVTRGLVPPVALLIHAADEPARAVFYPMADWSPEWVALQWAVRRSRPVRFMDLPIGVRFKEQRDVEKEAAEADEVASEDEGAAAGEVDEAPASGDPLGRLAALDGYEDGETWWNALVEESSGDEALFDAIESAMAALREQGVSQEDERREAHMRAEVAGALDRTRGSVVAVCGAWHAPALRGGPRPGDKDVLKRARKAVNVVATWVPWTDSRLTAASGYGAGIASPGWYRALWEEQRIVSGGSAGSPRKLAVRWQTRVARSLRRNGRPAATSTVIDAVRLTEALTAMRGLSRPGLPEMRDASLAVLCGGEEVPWQIVARELLEGTAIGVVPEDVPSTPLAADLQRQCKLLKLKLEAEEREIKIDLRSENGGLKSRLFHRLVLLDVPWGHLTDAGSSRGTFRENWIVKWEPELAVRLAEALRWGTTIEAAATGHAIELMSGTALLPELANAVRVALLAGLDVAADKGVRRIDDVAAAGAEVVALCQAVPPLVDVLRYGTAREMRLEGLDQLVSSLVDKVDIGLVYAARNLDAEASVTLKGALAGLDPVLGVYRDGARVPGWVAALEAIADDDEAAPLVAGFAARTLHDRSAWTSERVAARLCSRLSPGVSLADAAAWLEGFLADAAHVLIHDDRLLGVVDDWLVGLSEEQLVEALPLLRRATSSFGSSERTRLLRTIAGATARTVATEAPVTSAAFEEGVALLDLILGLGGDA